MFGKTSKREKAVLIICAILTVALFCSNTIILAPLIKFLFFEETCYIDVQYEKTPYAMGENYVYIAPTFFDEQNLEIDGRVSISYRGTKKQYKDGNFDTPIKNSYEYSLSLKEKADGEYYKKIDISCRNPRRNSNTDFEYSYGKYKYDRYARQIKYSDGENSEEYNICYEFEYKILAIADSGKECVMKVTFIVAETYEKKPTEQDLEQSKPQKLFEGMLDNLVSYSHFQ